MYIIHSLFEIVQLETFAFLFLISCLFNYDADVRYISTTISAYRSKPRIVAVERLITY